MISNVLKRVKVIKRSANAAFIHTSILLNQVKTLLPFAPLSSASTCDSKLPPFSSSTHLDLAQHSQIHHTPTHAKHALTPLSTHIKQLIRLTGPISIATFMRQALTSPHSATDGSGGGYYMGRDVFGSKGDFITAPEISQLFGEMIGVWIHSQWLNLGRPKKTAMVEVGPGRGTLMHDVLRVILQTKMKECELSVHLIEPSLALRAIQLKRLETYTSPTTSTQSSEDPNKLPITWYDSHEDLPDLSSPLFLLHELYDALPVHKFVLSSDGRWEEIMVDIDTSESPLHFRFAVSPTETDASAALFNANLPRYSPSLYSPGATIEVSPESWNITSSLATLVANANGSCLIIDYGTEEVPRNTLRGIRKHEFCDPLEGVGEHDLSCDVDFGLIKSCVGEVDDSDMKELAGTRGLVEYFGPIDQGKFLNRMGISERQRVLVGTGKLSKDEEDALTSGVERVIAMGADRYKVMVMQRSGLGVPFAFQRQEKTGQKL